MSVSEHGDCGVAVAFETVNLAEWGQHPSITPDRTFVLDITFY